MNVLKNTFFLIPVYLSVLLYLRLLVVLDAHGDHVDADDEGDEQVQVVAGAHLVDEQASGGVIWVVRLTLSFCWNWG